MSFNFEKYKDHKTFKILYPLAYLLRHFVYKAKIIGRENIPEDGGFIVVCNHIHAVDPAQIEYAFKGRPIHFMGKSEFWENPVIGPILTKLNGFPVVRGKADLKALRYAAELLRRGHIVGVFPEGTRQKKNELGRPKRGAALIAREAHADILPISICYEGKLSTRTKATMRIGKLIRYKSLGITEGGDSHELNGATEVIWNAVTALWEEGVCKE